MSEKLKSSLLLKHDQVASINNVDVLNSSPPVCFFSLWVHASITIALAKGSSINDAMVVGGQGFCDDSTKA